MIATEIDLIVFRILHIAGGVAWVGSLFLFVVFVQPSVAAIAPAGAPFMAELLGRRKLVHWLLAFATTTIVAGAYLYWKLWDAAGGFGDWVGSSRGATLTVGGVAALAAFSIGLFITLPRVGRMLSLGRQVAESGGPPSPEVAAEIQRLQATLKVAGRAALGLLTLSVLAMAVARYW